MSHITIISTLYYILLLIHVYNIYKNNKKTFSIKVKEDVGMSKPQKHANVGPKSKQTTSIKPYISTALCILFYSGVSTYVWLVSKTRLQ